MTEKVSMERACDKLGEAVDSGSMGEIVAKHEKMILGYYQDVKEQANKSFSVAKWSAVIGFVVIIFSLGYMIVFHAIGKLDGNRSTMTISTMSLISGALIEFVSAVAFVLYARGAKQFGAFHICLERTHRYLLAFKIAEEAGSERDKVLGRLVCIMANAPMISHGASSWAAPAVIGSPILSHSDVGLASATATS